MHTFTEYPDSQPCPCGSGKPYNVCCKTKKLRFGFDPEGNFKARIPISDQLNDALLEEWNKFQEYYGREPDHDYVLTFAPVCND